MIAIEQQGRSGLRSRASGKDNNPPARRRRRLLCISLVIYGLLAQACVGRLAAQQENSAGEYEVKAAILYNLTQFVKWPPSAYSTSQAPIALCVLGWDPFGSALTSVVSNKIVDGRPVQIRYLKNTEGARACQVLYVSSSERKRIVQILSNLKGSSVLTVGEMGQFAARGGMVQFALDDKRVRLNVNLDAANRGGVKISSRLLAIAEIVKDQDENLR